MNKPRSVGSFRGRNDDFKIWLLNRIFFDSSRGAVYEFQEHRGHWLWRRTDNRGGH